MAEYTEKEKVLEILRRNPAGTWRGTPVYSDEIKAAMREVKALKAADVAPVVRCRDCKYFSLETMECENEELSTDHEGGASYSLNFWLYDFCSYGEPRETDHETD